MPVDLATLLQPHNRFPKRALWRLTGAGIAIGAAPAVGTPGAPETVLRVWNWFAAPIRAAAAAHGVPCELLVATICSESAGGETDLNVVVTSRREEPGYTSDAATPDRVSVGCMQTLLETAAEVLGHTVSAADLCDPAVSIDAGARVIAAGAAETDLDPPLVAAAYNSGGLYLDVASANRWGLVCYPTGTGRYIDESVAWFNDAMRVGSADASLAGAAPSFARDMAAGA